MMESLSLQLLHPLSHLTVLLQVDAGLLNHRLNLRGELVAVPAHAHEPLLNKVYLIVSGSDTAHGVARALRGLLGTSDSVIAGFQDSHAVAVQVTYLNSKILRLAQALA